MILYFSATGNTAFIAEQIAQRLGDECVNLLKRIKEGDHTPLHSDTPFIICAPVYVCEMPRFLAAYLKKQAFTGSRDVYFVFTSGGYCGISGLLARNIFRKKGMNPLGHAELRMPRNYVASDAYPMLTQDEIRERLADSCARIDSIVSAIRRRDRLKARHVFLFETIVTLPFNPVWSRFKYRTKDFYADNRCIGCGKCARLCPLNNISIQSGKPVWGDRCTHCMACIGNCPTEAIEYGNITQNKDKYNLSKYKHLLDPTTKSEN